MVLGNYLPELALWHRISQIYNSYVFISPCYTETLASQANMELSQLTIFLAVAEERSFSRAAQKLMRTQPAISLAVQRLEA